MRVNLEHRVGRGASHGNVLHFCFVFTSGLIEKSVGSNNHPIVKNKQAQANSGRSQKCVCRA